MSVVKFCIDLICPIFYVRTFTQKDQKKIKETKNRIHFNCFNISDNTRVPWMVWNRSMKPSDAEYDQVNNSKTFEVKSWWHMFGTSSLIVTEVLTVNLY